MDDLRQRVEGFYRFLWPFLAASDSETAWLDEDTGGRANRDFLLDIPERYAIGPKSVVLDLGCGKGRESVALAKRYGCRVVAFDLLERNMELTRERIAKDGVTELVRLVRGSMDSLPFRDGSFDFVWSRDTLNHIPDLRRVFAEFARVLRPGGHLINYSALGTPWLEPGETARLAEPMGINPDSLSGASVNAALETAGLHILEFTDTDDSDSPYYEVLDDNGPQYLMRLARLLRRRKQAVQRLGENDYRRLLAYYLWNVAFLTGKMTYGVWVAERRV